MRNTLLGISVAGALLATLAPAHAADTGKQIDYQGFRELTQEVQAYREHRLVSLAQFQAMAREPGTIILDARSADAYRKGHIAGAINLSFSDFTAQSLASVLKRPDTRVLIYCNNNFENNAPPVILKSVKLALNIQTFINLYGYGYRNVFELGDVVNFDDPKVHWVRG
ncbi:MAG: rhodanese-like domain-containing protein [Micropepsaceae bacterium]